MLTIRLALYIFYNTVQSRLDSSHAMRASDAWIEKLAMFEVCITETVTLSPNTQMVVLTSSSFSISIT